MPKGAEEVRVSKLKEAWEEAIKPLRKWRTSVYHHLERERHKPGFEVPEVLKGNVSFVQMTANRLGALSSRGTALEGSIEGQLREVVELASTVTIGRIRPISAAQKTAILECLDNMLLFQAVIRDKKLKLQQESETTKIIDSICAGMISSAAGAQSKQEIAGRWYEKIAAKCEGATQGNIKRLCSGSLKLESMPMNFVGIVEALISAEFIPVGRIKKLRDAVARDIAIISEAKAEPEFIEVEKRAKPAGKAEGAESSGSVKKKRCTRGGM